MRAALAVVLVVFAFATAGLADTIHLKNGAKFEGELIEKTATHYVFKVKGLGTQKFPVAEVDKVVKSDKPAISDAPVEEPRAKPDEGEKETPEEEAGFFGDRGTKRGRDAKTEAAVKAALDWLARHQGEDGGWDGDNFVKHCDGKECDGMGSSIHDTGLAGLALLAFLGDGQTHKQGDHKVVVKEAMKFLKSRQDPEGCYGSRIVGHFVYDHAAATLAMIEAHALTGSPLFKDSAQQAVNFITKAQNPYSGWRYGVRPGDSDSSVTGWMTLALHSAREAGLRILPESLVAARRCLEQLTGSKTGEVGYTTRGSGSARMEGRLEKFPPENTEALTAIGLLGRILTAENTKKERADRLTKKMRDRCLAKLPRWEEKHIDMYYWYYGSMALHQYGSKAWNTWNEALTKALLPHQAKEGCAKGSWDPAGPWGMDGGRVYATALGALMLETGDRHGRIGKK